MIATMAMNMPGPEEIDRATLVVVPAALLYQVRPPCQTTRIYLYSLSSGKTNWNPNHIIFSMRIYTMVRRS